MGDWPDSGGAKPWLITYLCTLGYLHRLSKYPSERNGRVAERKSRNPSLIYVSKKKIYILSWFLLTSTPFSFAFNSVHLHNASGHSEPLGSINIYLLMVWCGDTASLSRYTPTGAGQSPSVGLTSDHPMYGTRNNYHSGHTIRLIEVHGVRWGRWLCNAIW